MGYLVQKEGLSGFMFHPFNTFEQWETIAETYDKISAINKATELSKKSNCKYIVSYSGEIIFEIKTNN